MSAARRPRARCTAPDSACSSSPPPPGTTIARRGHRRPARAPSCAWRPRHERGRPVARSPTRCAPRPAAGRGARRAAARGDDRAPTTVAPCTPARSSSPCAARSATATTISTPRRDGRRRGGDRRRSVAHRRCPRSWSRDTRRAAAVAAAALLRRAGAPAPARRRHGHQRQDDHGRHAAPSARRAGGARRVHRHARRARRERGRADGGRRRPHDAGADRAAARAARAVDARRAHRRDGGLVARARTSSAWRGCGSTPRCSPTSRATISTTTARWRRISPPRRCSSALLADDGAAVVNADDPAWARAARGAAHGQLRPRAAPPTCAPPACSFSPRGSEWTLEVGGERHPRALPLIGDFNVANALAAAAAAWALGMPAAEVARAARRRCRRCRAGWRSLHERPTVLRDYAHTPDALERALDAVRPFTPGALIVVFGCGGDRDRGKRPEMGRIAEAGADLAIVTSDNPRTEDPERILDDIEAGMTLGHHERIEDRRAAIARAIAGAGPDDVILLAGKGHETYQIRGTVKYPFDERAIVREIIADGVTLMADAATPQASALAQPPFWTLDRVAEALGDRPARRDAGRRASPPTRARSRPGDCFVALNGESFDAHDFLADAVKKGAAALVVHDAAPRRGAGRAGLRGARHARRARRARRATAAAPGASRSSASWARTARRARRSCSRAALGGALARARDDGQLQQPHRRAAHAVRDPRRRRRRGDRDGHEPARRGRRAARDRRAGRRGRDVDRRGAPRGARRPGRRAARGGVGVRRRGAGGRAGVAAGGRRGGAAAREARRQRGARRRRPASDAWGVEPDGRGWVELDGVRVAGPAARRAQPAQRDARAGRRARARRVACADAARGDRRDARAADARALRAAAARRR